MRPTPFAIVAAVILVFIAVGGYLIFGRGGTGTGKPVTVNVSVTGATMNPARRRSTCTATTSSSGLRRPGIPSPTSSRPTRPETLTSKSKKPARGSAR